MQKWKILVIDDDPATVMLIQRILTEQGYDVSTAWEGIRGFQKLVDEKPNLLILDELMPGMSGYELLQKLRRRKDEIGEIPVIVISIKESMRHLYENTDVAAFISKPISPEILIQYVKSTLKSVYGSDQKTSSGKDVLVAGIQEFMVNKIKNHLESMGFTVEFADDEKEAFEYALHHRPRLILVQFWEDRFVFDSRKLLNDLKSDAATSSLLVGIFCAQALKLDVIPDFPDLPVILFRESPDLLKKMTRFLKDKKLIKVK